MRDFDNRFTPDPWDADKELIEYLVNWLDTTCVMPGTEIRDAVQVRDPERWRKQARRALKAGRTRDSIAVRDHVLEAIRRTEPDLYDALMETVGEPTETLSTPDVHIAETADAK